MVVAKVTSKGQITIPSEIRKKLGISYGDEVDFKIVDGDVVLESVAKPIDIEELKGILHSTKKVSDEELRTARSKVLSKKWLPK